MNYTNRYRVFALIKLVNDYKTNSGNANYVDTIIKNKFSRDSGIENFFVGLSLYLDGDNETIKTYRLTRGSIKVSDLLETTIRNQTITDCLNKLLLEIPVEEDEKIKIIAKKIIRLFRFRNMKMSY